ncbi:DUF4153 domain-containing protein [Polaribacter sp. SA4-12]|uniref:DUF4153 domain-containing protein n=1 Tax=Polaribacter sp. SA4-12 TaxID=1312072 RepID=UPI000B3CF120|nr:DUF4173 domain-containing protein [Polaribacter sp. SA4-12]ARV16650.1 hypothetical protein BTO07_16565 [Polaribacter sp. SA4-12]
MKNLITLVSAILFSTFFYQQNIGLNLSLFTLLTIVMLAIKNNQIFKYKSTIFLAIAYLITGAAVFMYKSNLAILANIIAFMTFIGSVSEHKSSIYVKWINGIYTVVVSYFSMRFDKENSEVDKVKKEKIDYVYWLKIIGIPSIILIIFINLYRNGNPMFDELISKIDFSFINFQWILFTALGYYLFYNISHPIQIEPATYDDLNIGNNLEKNTLEPITTKELVNENQLGIILMASLNALIILFLITDVLYLSELHQMVASQLSEQVHNGVNALIFSNVLAIVIILYFFRGNINFFEKNKGLKNLTFVWIFLNLTLVIITTIKNIEYINSFGFTYKRIGVLFFLIATSVGLITTFIKVTQIKNLWFLFRKNIQIAFVILILSATINWDKIITDYNINNADQMDLKYLINLSDNNTFLLKYYIEKNEINKSSQFNINIKHNNYIEVYRIILGKK